MNTSITMTGRYSTRFNPALDDEDVQFVSRHYGKSNVKLMHVDRRGKVHTVYELEVDTKLTLDSDKDYTIGDNSDIIATDTQKNIVYVLAKRYGIKSPEDFALTVADFFLSQYGHVTKVQVDVRMSPWQRVMSNGKPHNHAYVMVHEADRFTNVIRERNGQPLVTSGLDGLRVLKTTQSGFVNFHKDEFRTLGDAEDRVFSTIVLSHWTYGSISDVDFTSAWNNVKEAILEKFAGEPGDGTFSASVQNTLYEAEKLAMARVPQISSITMNMPNKHYFNVDMTKFPSSWVGSETNKTVFMPVDKPSGFIHASIARNSPRAKL